MFFENDILSIIQLMIHSFDAQSTLKALVLVIAVLMPFGSLSLFPISPFSLFLFPQSRIFSDGSCFLLCLRVLDNGPHRRSELFRILSVCPALYTRLGSAKAIRSPAVGKIQTKVNTSPIFFSSVLRSASNGSFGFSAVYFASAAICQVASAIPYDNMYRAQP